MVITDGIIVNADGSLSFGDYTRKDKLKVDGFEHKGDIYKLKTHDAVTRLEKNGSLFVESVPGCSFIGFSAEDDKISFKAASKSDVCITFELEPDTVYGIDLNSVPMGEMKSGSTGKYMFGVTLDESGNNIDIIKK